jgi:hypothetical protein
LERLGGDKMSQVRFEDGKLTRLLSGTHVRDKIIYHVLKPETRILVFTDGSTKEVSFDYISALKATKIKKEEIK